MAFKFPFTNYHELNLTWILDQLKSLFEQSEENVTTIETYEDRLTAVETEIPGISETASEASRAAAAAGTLAQTATQKADTAQENAIQAQGVAGTARQEAQAAQTAANEATQAAQQAQATALNFDGRITQAENNASQALEASRSFENRVQSAITTANNANQTATNAQGIAMRADQNAGAALDKIGDLSQLTTTAKNNLVAAINEAAQSGGVTSVNGKTGAVVLDASDIGYNDTTVETALNSIETELNGKQNAPTAAGTAGQVLGLNNSLQPVWVDQTGGNCAPIIINTASGAVASFSDGADNRPVEKLVINIEQSQSGLTGAKVTRTGKNIFGGLDLANAIKNAVPSAVIDENAKTVTYAASAINNKVIFTGFKPNTRYTIFAYGLNNAPINLQVNYSNDSHSVLSNGVGITQDASTIVSLSGVWVTGTSILLYEQFGIIEGVLTAEDFEPYTGSIISVTFPTQAGTVYSGTLTLNPDRTGTLVVNTEPSQTYQLTSEDINGILSTLYGTNNIWSDAGSISVNYPADTKLYIDNKIAELQALVLEQ